MAEASSSASAPTGGQSAGLVSIDAPSDDIATNESSDEGSEGEASASDSGDEPAPRAKPKAKAAPVDDDPEIELKGLGKKKQSEWLKEYERAKGLERAAHERNREAALTKKQAQALWDAVKSDPEAVLRHRGVDPVQFAQAVLKKQMEEHALTPEQREQRDIIRERDELKAERELRAKADADAAAQSENAKHVAKYEQDFIKAIKATPGMPHDPLSVIRIAERTAILRGEGVDASPEEVAAEVREWDHKTIRSYLGRPDITIAEAKALVPEHVRELFRKDYVQQARPQFAEQPTKQAATKRKADGKYTSADDWYAWKQERARARNE